MSHHLAAARAGTFGQLYIDDMYVFPGNDSTVFIMNVNSSITGERSEPSFLPEARYEFKILFGEASREGLTYRLTFEAPDDDKEQQYTLSVLNGEDAVEDAVGDVVLTARTGQVAEGGNIKSWAGRIVDSFYIDLSLLGMVNTAVRSGAALDLSEWHPESAQNSFANTTVDSIVLEVSNQQPLLQPGTRIAAWTTTKISEGDGAWHQINRFGRPMLWPIFWPDDVNFTHPANTRHPSEDFAADGKTIAELIASTVAASGTVGDPTGYGQAMAKELLPDVMPYVIGTPAGYTFAGRNGRTLADNAPEVMLSLVTNSAVPSGLKHSVAEHLRAEQFPFVVAAPRT